MIDELNQRYLTSSLGLLLLQDGVCNSDVCRFSKLYINCESINCGALIYLGMFEWDYTPDQMYRYIYYELLINEYGEYFRVYNRSYDDENLQIAHAFTFYDSSLINEANRILSNKFTLIE